MVAAGVVGSLNLMHALSFLQPSPVAAARTNDSAGPEKQSDSKTAKVTVTSQVTTRWIGKDSFKTAKRQQQRRPRRR